MIWLGILGVIACFAVLIFAAYKKISMVFMAPVAAIIIAVTNGLDVAEVLSGVYSEGMVGFIKAWFLVIALGSLFGQLYNDSGAAWRIGDTLVSWAGPKWALTMYILLGGLLVYGGINIIVVIFVLLPFALVVFEKTGTPWYLYPAATVFSLTTFSMTMLPGNLQLQNIIPTQTLGTSLMATPVEGIAAAVFIFIVGTAYLMYEANKGRDLPEADIRNYEIQGNTPNYEELDGTAPSFVVSLIPMVITLVLINIFQVNIIYGLIIGCVIACVLFRNSIPDMWTTFSEGFNKGIYPTMIVASVVGVGRVVGATPVFELLRTNIINIPVSGISKIAAMTTIVAGITGSASGGLTMVMELFGQEFLTWGYSPEIVHRVAAIASGGLDTLPWNGTVVMLFALSGVEYRKGYKMVAVESVILPLLSLIPAILVHYLLY